MDEIRVATVGDLEARVTEVPVSLWHCVTCDAVRCLTPLPSALGQM